MFESGSHVYTLPLGVDFATNLVLGLQDRLAGLPPEAAADVRLYVNSQRMRRRVNDALTASGAAILPRVLLVTDLSQDPILADLPPMVTPLRRRLELSVLIDPFLDLPPYPAPKAALFDLADGLAALIDEMQEEGVSTATVANLDVSGHSEHWARTQAFLGIVAPFVAESSALDPAARRRLAVERLAVQWKVAPPPGFVIVAGSTGSRGATALFMKTVAGLPNGAVVLPGFDTNLPDEVWRSMDDALTAEDHPQFRFRRLFDAMELSPSDCRRWNAATPADPARNRLISLSLRPAPVTDQWLTDGQRLPDLLSATAKITLIEAPSLRSEATSVALIMRQAAETGKTVVLITPDRNLGRRVTAALDRWGILPDDSAGSPLAQSAPGRLLRHVARLLGARLTAESLVEVLKHPLTNSGEGRGEHLDFARLLEMTLREKGPAFPTARALLHWATALNDPAILQWTNAIAAIVDGLGQAGRRHLMDHVAAHRATAEAFARGANAAGTGQLWLADAGQAALAMMENLAIEAPHGGLISTSAYCELFESVIAAGEIRAPLAGHPRIAIMGAREAREQGADLVILGSLTDGVWPALAKPDPWLNRAMRKDAGLLLPERQIGLSALDYQIAMAAPEVVITRSVRDAEAETVPSRWLNRLINLINGLPDKNGPEAYAAMKERGAYWLSLSRRLDALSPEQVNDPALKPALRPAPRPPLKSRPDRISLSAVSTLIRDPYSIYARSILRLTPLGPLGAKPDSRDRGTAIHKTLEIFVRDRPFVEARPEARARLLSVASRILSEETPLLSTRLIWLGKLERAVDQFLSVENKMGGTTLAVESRGSILLGDLPFTIHGLPDRIDELPDGRLHLIDYKSGAAPTQAEQKYFQKQLLLAAAMAERGGFETLGPSSVARISYIGLTPGKPPVETEMTTEILDDVWNGMINLIRHYMDHRTGYAARRAMAKASTPSDYDHLSRFGEWQTSDEAVPEIVGPVDV